MRSGSWLGLLVAPWLVVACDDSAAQIESACAHICECEGFVLPSQQRQCTAACAGDAEGVEVSQNLLDCILAASCPELQTDACFAGEGDAP